MSDASRIRHFWKPDTRTADPVNESKLKAWLGKHAICVDPGSLTVVLYSPVHASVRKHLVRDLSIPAAPRKRKR